VYEVGDKVVYPQHGAGVVEAREARSVLGTQREYLTIRILASDMTLMVPSDGLEAAGIRPVISSEELDVVLAALRGEDVTIAGSWSRRFKHNRDKLRTGDIAELVEVIRNLAHRSREKALSSGERQMLNRAKRILASEIQYAKDLGEADALTYLDEILAEAAVVHGEAAAAPRPT
jgi:CarD family transcriptional regulator